MPRLAIHPNMKEPSTGIVHLWNGSDHGIGAGEYTLCGTAFDTPSVEYGQESMVDTDEPCNCGECISIADNLNRLFRKELRRVNRNSIMDPWG